jgi:hypothetical protein
MLNLNLNILGASNRPIVPIQPAPAPTTTTTTSTTTAGPVSFRTDPYSASLLFATPGNRFIDLGMGVDYSDVHADIAGVGSNLTVNTGSIGDPAYTNFLANGYINSTKVQSSASFYNENNAEFNFGAQPITIEGWINFGTGEVGQRGFYSDYSVGVPSLSGIWCSVLSDGRLRFITSVGSSEFIIQSGILGWSNNAWYHVAFVRSGSTYKIYRDGTEVASGTAAGTINSTTRPKYIMNFNNIVETQVFVQDYKIYTAAVYTSSFTPPLSMVTL